MGTIGDRGSLCTERLPDPSTLAAWLVAARLTGTPSVPSASIYRAALSVREAIARMVAAVVRGDLPAIDDVAMLNAGMRRWNSRPYLDPLTLSVTDGLADPIHAALGRIARDAIELLGNPDDRARLRTCGSAACGGIFLTPVRPERRWCSMERCGNRAKVAAFRSRRRPVP